MVEKKKSAKSTYLKFFLTVSLHCVAFLQQCCNKSQIMQLSLYTMFIILMLYENWGNFGGSIHSVACAKWFLHLIPILVYCKFRSIQGFQWLHSSVSWLRKAATMASNAILWQTQHQKENIATMAQASSLVGLLQGRNTKKCSWNGYTSSCNHLAVSTCKSKAPWEHWTDKTTNTPTVTFHFEQGKEIIKAEDNTPNNHT